MLPRKTEIARDSLPDHNILAIARSYRESQNSLVISRFQACCYRPAIQPARNGNHSRPTIKKPDNIPKNRPYDILNLIKTGGGRWKCSFEFPISALFDTPDFLVNPHIRPLVNLSDILPKSPSPVGDVSTLIFKQS